MSSVRIGLIGAGVIGAAHSAVLQQIGRALAGTVQLVAVADPVAKRRALFADLYGYRQLYAEGHQLLADAEINAAFICTPTRYHAELVQAAAARGLDIFCEKPLAMDYREGAAMVAAVERAGVRSQIGLVLRFSAVYTVMRELLYDPRAGRPVAVVFRDDQCFPIRGMHDSAWRADRTQTAGGTLIEHGVHDLDLLTWFFGPIVRLRAWEHNRAGHPGVEDYMAAELELAEGLRAQLVNVWHNMIQRPSNRRLEIFCENAFIASEADMNGDVIYQLGDGPQQLVPAAEVIERFRAMQPAVPDALRDCYGVSYLVQDLAFVESLLSRHTPVPDIRVGLEAQRLAAAVYHAARTGQEVDVKTFQPGDDSGERGM
ncbi:MAG TPA: Gfo/Idh/MocA family oxidoreductase [Candidatus Acidoferrales bacterium]|nr:Gfo/Idh/MocA family oxidoreductase [Candidatus Acidoferrales bacterium]